MASQYPAAKVGQQRAWSIFPFDQAGAIQKALLPLSTKVLGGPPLATSAQQHQRHHKIICL